MKFESLKVKGRSGTSGKVTASEFNSSYNELKNVVEPFMSLNENDNKQLVKSIDILSKGIRYRDVGTANNIQLTRNFCYLYSEVLFHGMAFLFVPKYANTGSVTIRLPDLDAKPAKLNNANVPNGYIKPYSVYLAIFDITTDSFNIMSLTNDLTGVGGNDNLRFRVKDGVNADDIVTVNQLNNVMNITDIDNSFQNTSTTRPASAQQGRSLKNTLNSINALLVSNDSMLDELQEIADFIVDTRTSYQNLSINGVNGLQDALDGKANSNHTHNERYYKKVVLDAIAGYHADKGGDVNEVFAVADPVNEDDAVPYYLFDKITTDGVTPFRFTESSNPTGGPMVVSVRDVWLNTSSGEMFVCLATTTNYTKWHGSFGTRVN